MTSYLSLIKQSLSTNKMLDMAKVRIEEHLIPSYSVEMMCKVLKVSKSSYYRRLKDPEESP